MREQIQLYIDSGFLFGRNHGFVVHCAYWEGQLRLPGIPIKDYRGYDYVIKDRIYDNNNAELDALVHWTNHYILSPNIIEIFTDSEDAIRKFNKPCFHLVKHIHRIDNKVNPYIYMVIQDLRTKFTNKKKSHEFLSLVGKDFHVALM